MSSSTTKAEKNFRSPPYRLRDLLTALHKLRVGAGIQENSHSHFTAQTISNSSRAESNSSASACVHVPMRWSREDPTVSAPSDSFL